VKETKGQLRKVKGTKQKFEEQNRSKGKLKELKGLAGSKGK
jgi:hypothetical protein